MRFPRCGIWLLGAAVGMLAGAQTQVDLRTQSKSVDFSGLPTKPFQMGSSLPATCSVGQTFFHTAAPAGMNFYACTAANVWTQQTQPTLPGLTGQAGKVLTTNGSAASWMGFSGDVSGTAGALTVVGLRGYPVAAANPAGGQALTWNAAASQWQPGTPSITLAGDAAGAAGSTLVKALEGRAVAATAPSDGQALKWNAGSSWWEPGTPSITLAGDAAGPVGSTVVRGLQGRALAPNVPIDGQGLTWSSAANQWQPGSPNTSLAGDANGPAGSTVVTGLRGRAISTNSPADGQGLTWSIGGEPVAAGHAVDHAGGGCGGGGGQHAGDGAAGAHDLDEFPVNGQALEWNGTANQWQPGVTSDAGGRCQWPYGSTTVRRCKGGRWRPRPGGQALAWNATTNHGIRRGARWCRGARGDGRRQARRRRLRKQWSVGDNAAGGGERAAETMLQGRTVGGRLRTGKRWSGTGQPMAAGNV